MSTGPAEASTALLLTKFLAISSKSNIPKELLRVAAADQVYLEVAISTYLVSLKGAAYPAPTPLATQCMEDLIRVIKMAT